jgi:hypothetical protein
MLRPKKFRPFERAIVLAIGLLLFAAGVVGLCLAIPRTDLRLSLASAGVILLAMVFLGAARRGRPL